MSTARILVAPARQSGTLGRPRSEKTRKAILKTAFRLLKKSGFDGISNRQIASEAGVSTATLYRWWKSKEAILLDSYLETSRELMPFGRRGAPLERLRKYTKRVAEFLKSDNGRVFTRLMLAIQDDAALRKAFYENVFLPRRTEGCAVVQEAIDSGDLPERIDPNFMIDMLIGPLLIPALLGQEVSAAFAEKVFDFVLKTISR
jgi:AcrR family transcriptional regulator